MHKINNNFIYNVPSDDQARFLYCTKDSQSDGAHLIYRVGHAFDYCVMDDEVWDYYGLNDTDLRSDGCLRLLRCRDLVSVKYFLVEKDLNIEYINNFWDFASLSNFSTGWHMEPLSYNGAYGCYSINSTYESKGITWKHQTCGDDDDCYYPSFYLNNTKPDVNYFFAGYVGGTGHGSPSDTVPYGEEHKWTDNYTNIRKEDYYTNLQLDSYERSYPVTEGFWSTFHVEKKQTHTRVLAHCQNNCPNHYSGQHAEKFLETYSTGENKITYRGDYAWRIKYRNNGKILLPQSYVFSNPVMVNQNTSGGYKNSGSSRAGVDGYTRVYDDDDEEYCYIAPSLMHPYLKPAVPKNQDYDIPGFTGVRTYKDINLCVEYSGKTDEVEPIPLEIIVHYQVSVMDKDKYTGNASMMKKK